MSTDVWRIVVASVFRLGVRLFLESFKLARNTPLAVSGRSVPRRLPSVLFRMSRRSSQTTVAGGLQPRTLPRYCLPGKRIVSSTMFFTSKIGIFDIFYVIKSIHCEFSVVCSLVIIFGLSNSKIRVKII